MDNLQTNNHRQMDVQLLRQAITELNISRLNVSMYPQNHPIVENSLSKAYTLLKELTGTQERIIIAAAKDILIINEQSLEEKNPVFKEFALSLNKLNIAQLTLLRGLSKAELYAFHQFLLTEVKSETSEDLEKIFKDLNLPHILIEFIDYSLFTLDEEEEPQEKEKSLWEEYISGLMEGKYQVDEVAKVLEKVPPEKIAELLNDAINDDETQELYGELMDAYFKRIFSKKFTGADLQKLLQIVNNLKPDLKRQFLSSAVMAASDNISATKAALKSISGSEVMNFLSVINEYMVSPPNALKNVFDEFSRLSPQKSGAPQYGGSMLEDDFIITPEMTDLLQEAAFTSFVTDSYQGELEQLLKVEKKPSLLAWAQQYEQDWRDENIEKDFNQIVLELALSDISGNIGEDELELYINILKDQITQFISIGQYDQVLSTFDILANNNANRKSAELAEGALQYFKSDEFIPHIIDSLRMVGRQRRQEALQLCEYYGNAIISPLLDALTDEDSLTIRRFIISLISHFGDGASPEILQRLTDKRWYVVRNMLFILLECGSDESLKKTTSFCRHSNPKVSFEAIKCLLKARDETGVKALRGHFGSDDNEIVRKAIDLSGAFAVHEVVPELIQMLEKKNRSRTDIENKIPLVRALGQMADSRAKDALQRVLDMRALLFRSALEKLKGEVKKVMRKQSSAKGTKTEK